MKAPAHRRRDRQEAGNPDALATAAMPRNLPLLLLRSREGVLARFRPLLAEAGLTEQQWRIIRVLFDAGPLEPREIVTLCGISSPSLAGVLARMDELGWVTRERLESDQRRQHVSLTPASRRLAQRLMPKVEATYARLEAEVGATSLKAVYAALDELLVRLEGHEPPGTRS